MLAMFDPIRRRNLAARRRSRLVLEELESRTLLSASSLDSAIASPQITVLNPAQTTVAADSATPAATNPTPPASAYTPSQIRAAYGFTNLTGDGSGQTIAIVDAYDDPKIQADLAAFDAQYSLAAPPSFKVVNQNGLTTSLPKSDPSGGWEMEEALDVEWAHAMAPGANIVLVEANSASLGDLFTAVQTAAKSASVVSMSWGGSEFRNESTYDKILSQYPNVTFVAASGDSGAGTIYPAVSPYVVAVGGTTMPSLGDTANTPDPSSQTAWGNGRYSAFYGGSGGGLSKYEAQPSYQAGVVTQSTTKRGSPDVSYDADPNTGFAVYDSVPYYPYYPYSSSGAESGWFQLGGTSAGAPQWSAFFSIVDQARTANKATTLGSTQALSILYGSGKSDLQDITSGSNGRNSFAGPGYDLATGLGTLNADHLVSLAGALEGVAPSPPPPSAATPHAAPGFSGLLVNVFDVVVLHTADVPAAASFSVSALAGPASATPLAAAQQVSAQPSTTQLADAVTPISSGSAAVVSPLELSESTSLAPGASGISAFSVSFTGTLSSTPLRGARAIGSAGTPLLSEVVPDSAEEEGSFAPTGVDAEMEWLHLLAVPPSATAPVAAPDTEAIDIVFADPVLVLSTLREGGLVADEPLAEEPSLAIKDWGLAALGLLVVQGNYYLRTAAEPESDASRRSWRARPRD
jgi:hypothetical protein